MSRTHAPLFLPAAINTGPWVAGYALPELKARVATQRAVLPICSFGTPPERLSALAPLVLPPLYHEALDEGDLKAAVIAQIRRCFPFFEGTRDRANYRGTFDVIELPRERPPAPASKPQVLAFGVDTTVEEHGPHLPLATDTIQTYAVLKQLASENAAVSLGPALDYGHLTWGLPYGMSIDLTPALLTRYMRGFVNALVDWLSPAAMYVADVHGSAVHRAAAEEGLRSSRCARWKFRWIHEPLGEFSAGRGDPHAGGVETALVNLINPHLVDATWWPQRADTLAAGQMTQAEVFQLTADMPRFIARVEAGSLNGIIGDIHAATSLDARDLFDRMLTVARADVAALVGPA